MLVLKVIPHYPSVSPSRGGCETYIADLARRLPDPRSPKFVHHSVEALLTQHVYQLLGGYVDCNDANTLRHDPIFKLLLDRLPETGAPLASQPTLSRFENRVSRTELYRMARVGLDLGRVQSTPRKVRPKGTFPVDAVAVPAGGCPWCFAIPVGLSGRSITLSTRNPLRHWKQEKCDKEFFHESILPSGTALERGLRLYFTPSLTSSAIRRDIRIQGGHGGRDFNDA
jgi:hypothetical protein